MLLGGLGSGLFDLSPSAAAVVGLAGVAGPLPGAGLGAIEGAGLEEAGAGLGEGVVVRPGFVPKEPTLQALDGRTRPSALPVRGAGLREGTFTFESK